MSERKSWSSTVVGWFVERPEGDPPSEVDAAPIAAPTSAAKRDPSPTAAVPLPAVLADGRVDFPAVYTDAGIDGETQTRVAKAAELLTKLPPGTDPAVKQQIVSAALDAFGVPTQKIIEGAVLELQALEAYLSSDAADAKRVLEESQERITQFEREIGRIRTVMTERVTEQQAVLASCNAAKLEIQKVLEFFGREAVAQVVRESPKLTEPT